MLLRMAIQLSFGFVFVTTQILAAQTFSVTGTVKDAKGVPIPSGCLPVEYLSGADMAGFLLCRYNQTTFLLLIRPVYH
jgi:hypothetical protein